VGRHGAAVRNVADTNAPPPAVPRYLAPVQGQAGRSCALVWRRGTPGEFRYVFCDQVEIGRDVPGSPLIPGVLLIDEPTVSRRHCVVRLAPDGRCFARDVSRNGTRLDGRRIVPNLEVEIRPGQALAIGAGTEFVLEGERVASLPPEATADGRTTHVPGSSIATVLVGDIRDYTVMVRRAPQVELQRSVSRVFEVLNRAVTEHQGTVKEYQGDAILAFWEGELFGKQAAAACAAALALDRLAQAVAADRSVWLLPEFPLRMDWALATGAVVLDSFGGIQPTGLSLIGAPVVLAFRLEKFATDATGRILTCPTTMGMASHKFRFRDLGLMHPKGFDAPDQVFALEGER
jgi:adenylate cyclase